MSNRGRALVDESWKTLLRHVWVALPIALICGAVVAFFALQAKTMYNADSSVFVLFGREFSYRPEVGSGEDSQAFDLEEIVNTEVQIMESRDLAVQVVDEIGPETLYPSIFEEETEPEKARQKAILAFRDGLSVLPVLESSVINCRFTHESPPLAADALNKYLDAFLERHLELFRETKPGFIDDKLTEWQEKLRTIEGDILALKAEHGFVDLSQQSAHLLSQEAELNRSWIAQRAQIAEIESQRKMIESMEIGAPENPEESAIDTVEILQARRDAFAAEWSASQLRIVELDHQLAALRSRELVGTPPADGPEYRSIDAALSRLLELQIERERAANLYRTDSRKVQAVTGEIAAVERFLATRASAAEKAVVDRTDQSLSSERTARVALRDDLATKIGEIDRAIHRRQLLDLAGLQASVEAQKAITESLRDSVREEIRRLERISQEVVRLGREQATAERNVDTYLQRREDALIAADLDRQKRISVRVLERASVPIVPIGLSPKLKIALGLIAGLFAGIAAAVGLEMLRREED